MEHAASGTGDNCNYGLNIVDNEGKVKMFWTDFAAGSIAILGTFQDKREEFRVNAEKD